MRPKGTSDPIFQQALEWLVRLKDETPSDVNRRAHEEWLDQSPAHREAYERAKRLWERVGTAAPEIRSAQRKRTVSRRGLLGLGAAAILGPGAAYLLKQHGYFADYTTAVAQRHAVSLPDGSLAELGSYSSLSDDTTGMERRLRLYRGQTYFDVVADGRPFIVDVAGLTVRAMGTRFDVRYVDGEVTVSALEHAVEVAGPGMASVVVEDGWQIALGARSESGSPSRFERDVVEAWRQDRIVFQDAPLRRVLAELERYRHGHIVLADDAIGDIRVTAVFRVDEADNALRIIARSLPVDFIDTGLLTVVYRR